MTIHFHTEIFGTPISRNGAGICQHSESYKNFGGEKSFSSVP